MKKKKRRTGWIWLLVLLLGAGAFYKYYWLPRQLASVSVTTQYSEYAVTRGTVSVTVTGSGLLEAAEDKNESVIGGLKIKSTEAKEGDRLTEGDVLYTLDPDTIEKRILAVSQDLAEYRRALSRFTDYSSVKAPGKGRVKVIYAKKGNRCADVMLNNGCLAILSADELMAVEIETEAKLRPGNEVKVEYKRGGRAIIDKGTVEALTETGCTIVFPDKNALPGDSVQIKRSNKVIGSGTAYIHMPLYVYNTDGVVKTVNSRVNDAVTTNTNLFSLSQDEASDSYRQAVHDRDVAAEELLELMRYRLDPVIRVKNTGTLASIKLAENDVTAKDACIAVLHTGGAVRMTVDIDETDIPGLRLAQKASVTLDAYPDTPFSAEVTRIPVIGVQSGSITVYKTELTLKNDDKLLEGMHGSAVITLETREDVVMVPVAVLEEDESGAYVLVSGAAGAEKKYVKTGISDGTIAEITEGLTEGDILLYVPRGGTDMISKMMARNQRMMGRIGG